MRVIAAQEVSSAWDTVAFGAWFIARFVMFPVAAIFGAVAAYGRWFGPQRKIPSKRELQSWADEDAAASGGPGSESS